QTSDGRTGAVVPPIRKCATSAARVNTLFPSVSPVTSLGRTAFSDFGFETSVLYESEAPRYWTVGLEPRTGSPAVAGSRETRSARYRNAGMIPRASALLRSNAAT